MTTLGERTSSRPRCGAALLAAVTALVALSLAGPAVDLGGITAPARPVVVWGGGSSELTAQAVTAAGADAGPALGLIAGVATTLDAAQVRTLEQAGFSVADDVPMEVAGTDLAEVPAADHQLAAVNPGGDWDLDAGAGVGVALVDTGVTEVEDLRGRVVHGPDLSGEGSGRDTYGHGTFMAGLIAGDGTMSASGATRHVGVAPGAHIVSVKVAGADGATTLSKVLDAIGWVVTNADEHAVRVLNLSVAFPVPSNAYQADPLSAAVEAAWATGITVVAAAGNDADEVPSPGRDPWVITVGALDLGTAWGPADDSVPDWSGRQTTRYGAKPELLAPGVSVVSLAAPGSTVVAEHPGSVVDGQYLLGTGTSMATAMTSGAVAVLTEHHAAATPDDYKAALVATGRALPGQTGVALDLAAADLVPAGAPEQWWQRYPVAFDGLGGQLGNAMPWAGSRWTHKAWVGSRWAGSRWAGSRWADHHWTGSRWADEEFAGARWAGSRWAGSRWAGSAWSGSRWAGSRWADEVWAGSRWAGSRWTGSAWTGSRWAGSRWADEVWAGSRWAGSRWAGSRWAGSAWTGSRWAGSRWAGVSWTGDPSGDGWAATLSG
ncbi:MAG: S8 family serine peptidase [Acidimicrobiales bacterium]